MQLQKAFARAGLRPGKGLYVARLESWANLKNPVVGNLLKLAAAKDLAARKPSGRVWHGALAQQKSGKKAFTSVTQWILSQQPEVPQSWQRPHTSLIFLAQQEGSWAWQDGQCPHGPRLLHVDPAHTGQYGGGGQTGWHCSEPQQGQWHQSVCCV